MSMNFLKLKAREDLLSLQKETAYQILSDFPILMYDNPIWYTTEL